MAAFLAGGWIPASLRGTQNNALMHVADVYPTLCNIVGVDPTDNAVLPYGAGGTARPIDGVPSPDNIYEALSVLGILNC